MKLKDYIFTTLLLAIGFIMHHITPGFLGGMKCDFLILFMFASLLLNSKFENAILTGLLGGILAAMTTTFPGGQIPNLIDKMVTSLSMYFVIKLLKRFNLNIITLGIIGALGTFISGMTFLTSALFITGLPAPMPALITAIVVPTAAVNTVAMVFIYKALETAVGRIGINI